MTYKTQNLVLRHGVPALLDHQSEKISTGFLARHLAIPVLFSPALDVLSQDLSGRFGRVDKGLVGLERKKRSYRNIAVEKIDRYLHRRGELEHLFVARSQR